MPERTKQFSRKVLADIDRAKILGVRAGKEHRFTGVWPIVLNGRLFVRSWDNKPQGWYQTFSKLRTGAIEIPSSGRQIAVRARRVRGERLLDAMDAAYSEKYPTAASRKYVRGLAQPTRRANTLELIPL